MGKGIAEISINASPEDVWAVVADFGGIDSWMPGIESCRLAGEDRVIQMLGMEVVERLYGCDDASRKLVYGIVGGGVPVQSHRAEICVRAGEGGSSHVTWSVEVEPDDMVPVMEQVYSQSLEALRRHVEGQGG
jgi:carbon monoxide dehydrogenase subunit G